MYRRSFSKLSAPSIPSFGAVSLTGTGWMVRHKDAWEEKHHVFFSNSTGFYQNTASATAPSQNLKASNSKKSHSADSWVWETSDGQVFGRTQIQITKGDFQQGVLLIELANNIETVDALIPLAELITSQFLGSGLDTLKIMPIGITSQELLRRLTSESQSRILTFSNEFLNTAIDSGMHQFDRDQWLTSDLGKLNAEKLTWLSRRVERAHSVNNRNQNETKRPWLFSLLSRRRKRDEKMIHPLDKIRSRCY